MDLQQDELRPHRRRHGALGTGVENASAFPAVIDVVTDIEALAPLAVS
jgi:hypothetical protein